MKDNTLKFEAIGDFPFMFIVEKAVVSEDRTDAMIVSGVASSSNLDHDNERMSPEAIQAMANIINTQSVPLRVEHQKDDNSIIGKVYKATVDERNQLIIEAELDNTNSAAALIYGTMKNGAKLGFSVGGAVKKAVKEFSEKTGRIVKTFYDVILNEVSLTNRPANYDSWCFAKSITVEGESADRYRNTDFYKEFLFENRKLDYMYSFAKSVPDKAWHKVAEPINSNLEKNMDPKKETSETVVKEGSETKVEETKEKAVETETKVEEKSATEETKVDTKEKAIEDMKTETKEKSEETKDDEVVTAKSFKAFQDEVVTSFETLADFVAKAMKMESATDDKETAKAETKEETKEKADEGKDVTVEEAKPAEDYKTKAGEQEEQNAGLETKEEGEGYAVKIKSALRKMQEITCETKEKAETVEDTKETTEKSIKGASLDELVLAISGAVEKIEKSYRDKGITVPGLTSKIVDAIKTDKDMQEAITSLIKEPGFKKSVAFGKAYMATKDGKMFSLSAEPVGEVVEKSQDGKATTFSAAYKQNYAASK